MHTLSRDNHQPNQNISCILFKENHYSSNCKIFSQKSPFHRKEFLISQKQFFNCLGPHMIKDRLSQKSCQKFKRRHHTINHDSVEQSHQLKSSSNLPTKSQPSSSQTEDITAGLST